MLSGESAIQPILAKKKYESNPGGRVLLVLFYGVGSNR
jgi:hypothetical protein